MERYGLKNAGRDGNDMTQFKSIYLDNAATMPLSDSMKKYLISIPDSQQKIISSGVKNEIEKKTKNSRREN